MKWAPGTCKCRRDPTIVTPTVHRERPPGPSQVTRSTVLKLNAVRTASQRAAAKKADDEEAKKKAAAADSDEMEGSEDDEEETEASEDDCDTDDDAPNPPVKKKNTAKKAAASASDHRAAEKSRIKAIVTSSEAEGREELAEHLAYDTSMTAKQAVAMLSKAPKGVVEASEEVETTDKGGRDTFRAAMRATAQGDGKVASGKGKAGALKAVEDMSDDEYLASLTALSSPFGLTKA